ncbi:MAG TPA: tol-pal system protein YbgF [Polyangia bacterium]
MVTCAGCGDALERGQLADLQKRLDESLQRQAHSDKKLGDLEDQVFLLTDKIESQKVATSRASAPRLPVVTLRPSQDPESAASDTAANDESAGDGAPGGEQVVYEGDARTPTPDRVRASFTGSTVIPASRHLAAPISSAPEGDNLGVAPAPDVARAARAPEPTERAPIERDPLKVYRAAQEDLRLGKTDAAQNGFRTFLRRFPHHDYADNAQYWLGECYYSRKQFAEAATEFRRTVERYPLGNKAPDAMLKLGYSLQAMGEMTKARDVLGQVPESYPRSDAARLASERLLSFARVEGTK